jgi:hypothetical protein
MAAALDADEQAEFYGLKRILSQRPMADGAVCNGTPEFSGI